MSFTDTPLALSGLELEIVRLLGKQNVLEYRDVGESTKHSDSGIYFSGLTELNLKACFIFYEVSSTTDGLASSQIPSDSQFIRRYITFAVETVSLNKVHIFIKNSIK
jgi:hypothetical protein